MNNRGHGCSFGLPSGGQMNPMVCPRQGGSVARRPAVQQQHDRARIGSRGGSDGPGPQALTGARYPHQSAPDYIAAPEPGRSHSAFLHALATRMFYLSPRHMAVTLAGKAEKTIPQASSSRLRIPPAGQAPRLPRTRTDIGDSTPCLKSSLVSLISSLSSSEGGCSAPCCFLGWRGSIPPAPTWPWTLSGEKYFFGFAMVKIGPKTSASAEASDKDPAAKAGVANPSAPVGSGEAMEFVSVALVRRGESLQSPARTLLTVPGYMTWSEFRSLICEKWGLSDSYPVRLRVLGALSPQLGGTLMQTFYREAVKESSKDYLLYIQY